MGAPAKSRPAASKAASSQTSSSQSSTTTGQSQQNTLGNAAVQTNLTTATSAGPAATVLPKPLPGMIGNVNYYKARNADYLSRHGAPPPPDYYLSYGDKYARRFTTVLRPKLSATGQAWLDKTFVLLQNAMENRLIKDRSAYDTMEMDADAFRSFAYGTHPDAYLGGGLSKLGPADLAQIATTPDLGDLATLDGVSQILETGARLLPQWGGQAADAIGDAASEGWDATKRGVGQAADAIGDAASEGWDATKRGVGQAWDWATDW
jgi:hypothetical protein